MLNLMRLSNHIKKLLIAAVFVAFVFAVFVLTLGSARLNWEAISFNNQLFKILHPTKKAMGVIPMLSAPLQYRVNRHNYRGNIYRPFNEPRAGVVLLYDYKRFKRNDERIANIAALLARHHVLVLIPELGKNHKRAIQTARDSLYYLSELPDITVHGRVGFAAQGNSANVVLTAAMDSFIWEKTKYLFLFNITAPTKNNDRKLQGLTASVFIFHDKRFAARSLPHSINLQKRLAEDQAQLIILNGTNVKQQKYGLVDQWKLWRATFRIMRTRDSGS